MASKGTELGFDLFVCLVFLCLLLFLFWWGKEGKEGGEAWQVGVKSNVN